MLDVGRPEERVRPLLFCALLDWLLTCRLFTGTPPSSRSTSRQARMATPRRQESLPSPTLTSLTGRRCVARGPSLPALADLEFSLQLGNGTEAKGQTGPAAAVFFTCRSIARTALQSANSDFRPSLPQGPYVALRSVSPAARQPILSMSPPSAERYLYCQLVLVPPGHVSPVASSHAGKVVNGR